jgi:hypothetical protein
MILSQSVNPIELTYEEKGLVREIHNRFAVNEFEREIYFLKEYVEYMKGYLNNKLTADEYEYFTANMGTFKVMWKKYVDIDGIIDISRYMELFEKFYSENVERNRYFIKNVMGIMPQKRRKYKDKGGCRPSGESAGRDKRKEGYKGSNNGRISHVRIYEVIGG